MVCKHYFFLNKSFCQSASTNHFIGEIGLHAAIIILNRCSFISDMALGHLFLIILFNNKINIGVLTVSTEYEYLRWIVFKFKNHFKVFYDRASFILLILENVAEISVFVKPLCFIRIVILLFRY